MKAFTYDLLLLDPVLVNQVGGGDPNSATGFDYIPGSVIRGALIGKYLQPYNGLIDTMDETFRKLFFNSKVCFLNAYPKNASKRSLPVPLSWRVEKDREDCIYDFAIAEYQDEGDEKKVFNSVSASFWCVSEDDSSNFLTIKPFKNVHIHTARGNRNQMGSKDSSIFRYESLDKGQILSGVILVEDESLAEKIGGLLNNDDVLYLGKSHLVGYGRTRVNNFRFNKQWEEYTASEDDDAEDLLVVTLLSDTIIRDPSSGAYLHDISSLLGVEKEENDEFPKCFVNISLQGSFNRTWNLPTPQNHVIQAGSVFVYRYTDDLKAKLDGLKESGMGLRKEDGFGRIAVNLHKAETFNINPSGRKNSFSGPVKIESNEKFAKKIVERLLKAELDQLLLKKINEIKVKRKPKNHQLSSVRFIIRNSYKNLEDSSMDEPVTSYFKNMKSRGKKQFEKARVGDKSLLDWILLHFDGKEDGWRNIWTEIGAGSLKYSLGSVDSELTDSLALEYTVKLVDGVLHRAEKQPDEKKGKEEANHE